MAERQIKETISSSPAVTLKTQRVIGNGMYTDSRERGRQEKNERRKMEIKNSNITFTP